MKDEPALIAALDVVVLAEGVPERGVAPGALATVVHVHGGSPPEAFEVEVVSEGGWTIFLGPVAAEKVSRPADKSRRGSSAPPA